MALARGKDKKTTYRVKTGDNWFNVAEKLKTQPRNLLKANASVKWPVPGQVLRAPPQPSRPYAPTSYMAPKPPAALTARPTQVGETEEQQWARVREMRFPSPTPVAAQPRQPGTSGNRARQTSGQEFKTQALGTPRQTTGTNAATSYMAPQRPATVTTPNPRVAYRTRQKAEINTYANRDYVQSATAQGQLPKVISNSSARILGIGEDQLQELGYTYNIHGYWEKPMYEQLGAVAVGGASGAGAGGGGYGGYGGYGSNGYSSDGYPISPDYAVQNARRQTGYAGAQQNQFGSMPLVSWRI